MPAGTPDTAASNSETPETGDGSTGGPGTTAPAVQRDGAGASAQGEADGVALAPVDGAYFAELPVDAISPNPRQPRQVFDEEAMAELVHSVREIVGYDEHGLKTNEIFKPGPNGIQEKRRSSEKSMRTALTSSFERPAFATDCSAASSVTLRRARRRFIGRRNRVS